MACVACHSASSRAGVRHVRPLTTTSYDVRPVRSNSCNARYVPSSYAYEARAYGYQPLVMRRAYVSDYERAPRFVHEYERAPRFVHEYERAYDNDAWCEAPRGDMWRAVVDWPHEDDGAPRALWTYGDVTGYTYTR